METKANYVAVGAFTVLFFVALFTFGYWLSAGSTGQDAVQLDVTVQGSVTGLEVGAPVKFNGVDVGKVKGLHFDTKDPKVVIIQTEVRSGLPLTQSTRAVLGFTGLTGLAHIEFEGGNLNETSLFDLARESGTIAQIQADPSAFNDIIATAQDVFKRVDAVMGEVELFFAEARGPLTKTLQNTERFSQSLADNSEKIDQFLVGIGSLGETLESVSKDLTSVIEGVDGLVKAVKPEDVTAILANVESFTSTLEDLSTDVRTLTGTANSTLKEFEGAGQRFNGAFDQLDKLLAAVPPESINAAVGDIAEASKSARAAADDISTLTGSIEERQDDIDAAITNVAQMAERLNAASVRVDGVLAKLDGFLGSADGGDLFGEVSATLASFRQVANTLNARLDGITAGLERFSGRGLQDVEALVSDTRRSISRIESAITSIERDPQRLIFGGDGDVKRFDGRNRR